MSIILATCIAAAAALYKVPASQIDRAIAGPAPVYTTVGVARVPLAWLPLLRQHGFSTAEIQTNACASVRATAWSIAYLKKELCNRYATASRLPARAYAWQPTIISYAHQFGLDPSLVNAVILQESGFHSGIIGPFVHAGSERAVGLMQLLPSTAKELGVNPYDPGQNLWGGIGYLARLLNAYRGNLRLALASYNAGPNAVARHHGIPPYAQTVAYVPSVITRYARLRRQRLAYASPINDQ